MTNGVRTPLRHSTFGFDSSFRFRQFGFARGPSPLPSPRSTGEREFSDVTSSARGGFMSQMIPISRIPISVRPATPDDLPFIDALQKKHTKQVGWFPTKTIEG